MKQEKQEKQVTRNKITKNKINKKQEKQDKQDKPLFNTKLKFIIMNEENPNFIKIYNKYR